MINQDISNDSPARTSSGTRRGVTVGLAGGLLAGTAAGLVFGVPGSTSAAPSAAVVTPAAVVQQVDENDAPARTGERLRETLQQLVDDGVITSEQADAVTAHLVENRPERSEGRGERHGRPGGFGRGVASEALTDLLGIDAAELRSQLRDGATLAEIATAQGIEVQAVVDELVGELEERVADRVNNGRPDRGIEQPD